ncbi:hypothetical protein [Bacillus phage vB_BanS-Thrax3]|nr:hypothetical protein [Bacillus phage vB_BanS-Thrax3]
MEHIVQCKCREFDCYKLIDIRYEKPQEICEQCDEPMDVIPFAELKDPDIILEIIEDELENANMHSIVDIPREIFEIAKGLVKEEDYEDLARAIARKFYDNI